MFSKYFGKTKVLDNVSFNIPENSIIGILGPNGSGKSTLMRIIAGRSDPGKGKFFSKANRLETIIDIYIG